MLFLITAIFLTGILGIAGLYFLYHIPLWLILGVGVVVFAAIIRGGLWLYDQGYVGEDYDDIIG